MPNSRIYQLKTAGSAAVYGTQNAEERRERVVSFCYLQDLDAKEAGGKLGIGTNRWRFGLEYRQKYLRT